MTDPDYQLTIEGSAMDLVVLISLIGLGVEYQNRIHATLGHRPIQIGGDDFHGQLLKEVEESAVKELPQLTPGEIENRLREEETNLSVRLARGAEDNE